MLLSDHITQARIGGWDRSKAIASILDDPDALSVIDYNYRCWESISLRQVGLVLGFVHSLSAEDTEKRKSVEATGWHLISSIWMDAIGEAIDAEIGVQNEIKLHPCRHFENDKSTIEKAMGVDNEH